MLDETPLNPRKFSVLDAVCSQIRLGRDLFEVGVEKGFYAKVSRLGESWFELDLHFLSLGGGEIALGWWFEECLVPYLQNTEKLASVKSISIVTGYGKTRTRGRRHGDDGMRKRCKAMLQFMNIKEHDQSNLGRIHVDKESLIEEVNKNGESVGLYLRFAVSNIANLSTRPFFDITGGKIVFDLQGYLDWKERETTANVIPDTPQKIRARFKPVNSGSGRPPFTRIECDNTTEEYRLEYQRRHGRSIDRDDGEYRSDIDYAVRDAVRFGKGYERSTGGSGPADRGLADRERFGGGPGRNEQGPRGRGPFRGDSGRRPGGDPFDRYGPGPQSGRNDQQQQRRGFNGPQEMGSTYCNPERVGDQTRFDQGERDMRTRRDESRFNNDRRGSQFDDKKRGGADREGYDQPDKSTAGFYGGSSRNFHRDDESSRYNREERMDRRPEEGSFGDESSGRARNDDSYGMPSRGPSNGPPRGDLSRSSNRYEGRNGPPQRESGADDQQGSHNSRAERYLDEELPRRDTDRKRPFNEDQQGRRGSGEREYRRQESDQAERRSSTGSRGYMLDPPPKSRRYS